MGVDPVALALDHAYNVRVAADKLGGETSGEGFLRRAKDFPSLYSEAGLTAALVFYMSKSEERLFADALKLVSRGPEGCGEGGPSLQDLKGELGSREGAGYTIMLAAVVDAVYRLAGVKLVGGVEDPCSLDSGAALFPELARSIRELREGGSEDEVGQAIADYLVELKKAAEALLGGD